MKIKTDFVTNSSSSAFVVAFPKRIKTIADIEPYVPYKYAKTVLLDAEQQTPIKISNKNIIKELINQFHQGIVEHPANTYSWDRDEQFCDREGIKRQDLWGNHGWYATLLDENRLLENSVYYKVAIAFLKEIPNEEYYLYAFEYADDEGEYSAEMEHNDIFRKLPRIRINKH